MVVEGLSKSLCKEPEAAVQRRCGDHVSGGRVVNGCINCVIMPFVQTYNPSVSFAASSPYTGEPIEVHTNLIQCPYTGGGAYTKSVQTLFNGTN